MRIGELGTKADVSSKTIRYYEDIGLMADPGRTASGYRAYGDDALERLRFIKAAQAVCFTLGDQGGGRREAPCMHVTQLMEKRVRTLSEHIRGLQEMRRHLQRLVEKARRCPVPSPARSATSSRTPRAECPADGEEAETP